MNRFLYRGVSKVSHLELGGRLIPNGERIEISMSRSDHDPQNGVFLLRDATFVRGDSEINTVRAHQMQSGMHDGCFLSTSRLLERAKEFATNNFTHDGVVYVIDPELFENFGIVSRSFRDPLYPTEQEVSIRASDGQEICNEIVVGIIDVPI